MIQRSAGTTTLISSDKVLEPFINKFMHGK